MSEYNYFVSYKWYSKDGTGSIEGHGRLFIKRDALVKNIDDIAGMEQCIKEQSDIAKISPVFSIIILNWRRFEDAMPTMMETCICAAIKTTCGKVIRGHRHHDCISIIQANGIGDLGSEKGEQGFVTSTGRFVTREQGYELQVKAGIESIAEGGYRGKRLFSEDLY